MPDPCPTCQRERYAAYCSGFHVLRCQTCPGDEIVRVPSPPTPLEQARQRIAELEALLARKAEEWSTAVACWNEEHKNAHDLREALALRTETLQSINDAYVRVLERAQVAEEHLAFAQDVAEDFHGVCEGQEQRIDELETLLELALTAGLAECERLRATGRWVLADQERVLTMCARGRLAGSRWKRLAKRLRAEQLASAALQQLWRPQAHEEKKDAEAFDHSMSVNKGRG